MNSDTAASAVSFPTAAGAAVGVRNRFPSEAKVADPVPAPSNLRKNLLSTIAVPPYSGHCRPGTTGALDCLSPGLSEPPQASVLTFHP